MKQAKFYTFRQNNSGGVFDIDEKKGIGHFVIIQAKSKRDANNIARKKVRIYFDGCESNIDCNCCGDRWYKVEENNSYKTPMIYDKSVYNYVGGYKLDLKYCFIHYLDGRVEKVTFKTRD